MGLDKGNTQVYKNNVTIFKETAINLVGLVQSQNNDGKFNSSSSGSSSRTRDHRTNLLQKIKIHQLI